MTIMTLLINAAIASALLKSIMRRMSAFGGKADQFYLAPQCLLIAKTGHSRQCPTSLGMTAFNTTRTLRRMFNGKAYLDRVAPRFAPAKFLALAFTRGLLIAKSARRRGEIPMQTAGSGPNSPSTAVLAMLPVTTSGHPGNFG